MHSLLAYLAPVALFFPTSVENVAYSRAEQHAAWPAARQSPASGTNGTETIGRLFQRWDFPPLIAHQVRIERRVTVRIVPRSPADRMSLMEEIPEVSRPTRYQERKIGKCLTIKDIAGVQTGSGDRLLLYLRDRRMITARLEKACRARDFYSGFYLERNEDGKLCVERDKLQSRAGANCQLARIRELVPLEE